MRWGFGHMQAPDGGSLYLRLSTRPLAQPERTLDEAAARQIVEGAYWALPPSRGLALALVYTGPMAPAAAAAPRPLLEDCPGGGLPAVAPTDTLSARRAAPEDGV